MRILIALLAVVALLSVACRDATTPTATPAPTALLTPTATPTPFVPSPALTRLPTATPTPTAGPASVSAALMGALRKMPPAFRDSGFWLGNAGLAALLAGFERPLTHEERLALSQEDQARYRSAGSLLMEDGVLLGLSRDPAFREAFGFTGEGATVVARTGRTSLDPFSVAYMEGPLQPEEIIGKLRMLGYQPEPAAGRTYYTVRGDREIDGSTEIGRLAMNKLNRLYVGDGVLVRAPETSSMVGILQAWAGESPSLADDPAFGRTAEALGDVLAAAMFTREVALDVSSMGQPPVLEKQQGWGTLRPWDAVGFGQGVDGQRRWWAIVLHYPEPLEETLGATGKPGIAAALDVEARELTARLQGFVVHHEALARAGFPARPFVEWCGSVSATTAAGEGGATVTVRCALKPDAPAGAWVLMVDSRQLAFLLP